MFPKIKVGTADSWNKYADGTADALIQGGVEFLYVSPHFFRLWSLLMLERTVNASVGWSTHSLSGRASPSIRPPKPSSTTWSGLLSILPTKPPRARVPTLPSVKLAGLPVRPSVSLSAIT